MENVWLEHGKKDFILYLYLIEMIIDELKCRIQIIGRLVIISKLLINFDFVEPKRATDE